MSDRYMTRLAVFTVVYNDKGEVLLQQRGPNSYLAGHWDFPSGHVEKAEDVRAAAARELLEETNLTVRPDDLQLMHIDHYSLEVDYMNFVFVTHAFQGEATIMEPDKCSGIRWFNPNALPEKCVNAVRAFERAGFGSANEVTYSVTDTDSYEDLMGEPLRFGGLKGQ